MSIDLNQTSSGGSFILRQSRYATDLNSQLEILPSPHVVTEIRVEIGCLNLSHIPTWISAFLSVPRSVTDVLYLVSVRSLHSGYQI